MRHTTKIFSSKRALLIIIVMIVLTPLFAWATEMVEYSEPLNNVAEMLGVEEEQLYSGLLPNYTLPGLGIYIGTFVSAVAGVALTLLLAYGIGRVLRK